MRTIEAAISTPDVSGIVVCGAAGVGKSRVVREVLAAAAAIGSEVRWVVATASAKTLPLGAFASYAESAFTDSLQLVRGVIDTLTSASPGTPVIVSVDDAHLLDDLSAFVLHQIVQRAVAKVVVTVRAGEQVPAALQDLWKGGDFDRLDLQPLSMDETLALLTATLDGRVEPDAARRLWRLTRGNILYLRNIVEQEIGDGRFAPQQGYWQWTGDPKVPPGLAELIDTRMGSLPPDVSEVVDLLAVGEPVELPSLVRMTSSVAVERAEAQGLISLEDSDGRVEVRVAHPLYGEVRRNRAPVMRLRRLRSRVADELAASDHRDDMQVVVRRATLSLDADLTPPPELFVKAAHGAAWQVDVALAERLAGAAVRAGGGADAMFIHAYLLSWLGRGRDAEALLAGATSSGDTDADRAKLVFARATNRLFGLADDVGARQLIDDAEQVVPAASRSCLDAARVVYFAATGEPRAALEASRRVVFSDLPDAAARMSAWAMTVAAGDAGRATEAVAAAEAGYPIAIRGYLVICDAHANALVLAGQIRDAEDVAAMLRQRAKDYPSPQLDPVTAGLEGRVALAGGRLDAAVSILKPIVDMLNASQETIGWTYRFSLPYFTAIAMQGFADDASAAAALEQKYHPGWRYLDYDRALALGWVAAGQGAVTEAIATVVSAAETCRANGQFAAEVMCLQTAVQFGDESCAPRLRELTSIVEGPRAAVAARFAEALIRGDGAELAAVSGDFERIGDLVAAMDAAAHAAVAHKRADRKGSALTSSVRAGELARRCGGASTPALRKASEPVPLTDREREIVMLIGQGLTSPAIAKRLTLSVRTVEGHIYRAMAKTGAADRDELGAMLPKR
jgi:DNA-binding CsgD family transcriptional regulator